MLRPAGGDVYALAVDAIHDHEELVVKPAAPAVMATGLYAGTTLADDGSPILLFDPAGHRPGRRRQAGGARARRRARRGPVAATARRKPVLLFRGLDGARRALRLGVVDRIEEVAAEGDPAGRGPASGPARRGDPAACRASTATELGAKRSACSASTMAHHEIGYAFREVIDLLMLGAEVIPATSPGEMSAA